MVLHRKNRFVLATNTGFTMLEAMVVVAIMLILTVWARPSLVKLVDNYRLFGYTQSVQGTLGAAKARALANPNMHCGVYFNLLSSPQKVVAFFDVNINNVFDSGIDRTYMNEMKVPKGVSFNLPADSIVSRCIVFRGNGSAKTGGSIRIKNTAGQIRTVNVLTSTGRIKVTNP